MRAVSIHRTGCNSKQAVSRRTCSTHVSRPSSSRCHQAKLQRWQVKAGNQGPSGADSSSGNGKPQSIIKDSDLSFVGKLVVASFGGAFLIKYGSLIIPLPFEPNGAIAIAIILGTPALYSLYLLTQKQ